MTFRPILRFEPQEPGILASIRHTVGPVASLVCGLHAVDPTRGTGVIDDRTKCVWTREGNRVELAALDGGGWIASKSREVDPLGRVAPRFDKRGRPR